MVVKFTTTYTITACHQESCEFESRSWRDVLVSYVIRCVSDRLAAGRWFPPGTPVYSTNKTDQHDITEILLKVALNTIPLILIVSKCYLRY
jgi:hypothetical protein